MQTRPNLVSTRRGTEPEGPGFAIPLRMAASMWTQESRRMAVLLQIPEDPISALP